MWLWMNNMLMKVRWEKESWSYFFTHVRSIWKGQNFFWAFCSVMEDFIAEKQNTEGFSPLEFLALGEFPLKSRTILELFKVNSIPFKMFIIINYLISRLSWLEEVEQNSKDVVEKNCFNIWFCQKTWLNFFGKKMSSVCSVLDNWNSFDVQNVRKIFSMRNNLHFSCTQIRNLLQALGYQCNVTMATSCIHRICCSGKFFPTAVK